MQAIDRRLVQHTTAAASLAQADQPPDSAGQAVSFHGLDLMDGPSYNKRVL